MNRPVSTPHALNTARRNQRRNPIAPKTGRQLLIGAITLAVFCADLFFFGYKSPDAPSP